MSWFRPCTWRISYATRVRENLDLGAILSVYSEERGYPPCHSTMMVGLLLYACSRGSVRRAGATRTTSPISLAAGSPLIWLAAGHAIARSMPPVRDAGPKDRARPPWRQLKRAGRRSRYRLRKQIVEPLFGQIKHARGFCQFLLRGLDKVRAEWAMICTAHNLLKLANATG
jgi:hypothetical protein